MSRFLTRAGEQVAELADRSADDGRLSRGRALFRKGSVSDLFITEGSVTARVRGSRGDRYEATVSTVLAPPGVRREVADGMRSDRSIDELIADGIDVCPREIDLAFVCDCPDWDEPCKHVVAVFLAFADRVDLDEAELLHWRGIDPETGTGSEAASKAGFGAGSGAGPTEKPNVTSGRAARPRASRQARPVERNERNEPSGTTDAGDRTARLSELQSLLGDTAMRVPAVDDAEVEPPPSVLEPALMTFLGVDLDLDPVDVTGLATPAPLFADVELGPLADLGPVLAEALTIISAGLDDTSTSKASPSDTRP